MNDEIAKQDITERLRIRAEIRRQAKGRRSVEEGKPDRLADLLDEAAAIITSLRNELSLNLDEVKNESNTSSIKHC